MSRIARSRMGRAVRAAPSFSLDFTKGVLDPRLTFTRASGATYIDSTGVMQTAASNAPRFDYDPVTLAIRGLLIEEARTNLVTLSRSAWGTAGAAAGAYSAAGSDGAANAAYLVAESTSSNQQVSVAPTVSFVSGTTYTLSVIAKPGTISRMQVSGAGAVFGTGQYANFSLTGGGSVLASAGITASGIRPSGNGFYHCWIALAATATTTGNGVLATFVNSDTATRNPVYTGSASNTLILDHAQVEAGAFPTSIIPTSGAAATRAAETCVNGNTVSMLPWLSPKEGTTWVEYVSFANAGVSTRAFTIRNSPGTNALNCANSSGGALVNQKTANSAVSSCTTRAAYTPNTLFRAASSYDSAIMYGASNGAVNGAGNTTTAPFSGGDLPGLLDIGSQGSASQLNGWIRGFQYFPVALPLRELQRLTATSAQPAPTRINPDFSLHFLDGVLDSRITFTRASSGTRIDATGTLVTAATNVPRFDYDPITLACRGLLCEEARTNLITRNDMSGAVAGTPGTLPTGWTRVAAGTINVVGTGTENGAPYVDIQFVTPSAMSLERMTFQSAGVAVTVASTYCSSFCARLIAGSFTNVSLAPSARITWRDSGGTLLSTTTGAATISPTAPNLLASRVNTGAAVAPASAAFGVPELVYSSSGASDFTLRIALQQFELGAFPSSFIATAGATATRAADLAQVTDVSWFNKAQGVFVAEHAVSNTTESGVVWELRQGTSGSTPNRFNAFANSSSGRARLQVFPAGVLLLDAILGTPVANAVTRSALSYSQALHLGSVAGSAASQTTNTLPDFTPGVLNLASTNNTQYGPSVELNGWLRHFDYYKQTLPADFITELSR